MIRREDTEDPDALTGEPPVYTETMIDTWHNAMGDRYELFTDRDGLGLRVIDTSGASVEPRVRDLAERLAYVSDAYEQVLLLGGPPR